MIYIEDSIMQKGKAATAGSKILKNFTAPFDATVFTRLAEKCESVKLAEFGLGDPGELPGSPLLCNDVFGYVRLRAVEQDLCYIRPSYGTVSRYGLIPTASSMDQIGVVCKNPIQGFSLLAKIAGHDEKDGVMFPEKSYSYKAEKKDIKIENITDCAVHHADICTQVMNILAYAEISNNISRYDGIKFGYRTSNYKGLDDLYTKTRTEAFGLETKLAAIMGCLILSQEYYAEYYEKAMKIRRLIKESLLFETYNVLIIPPDSPLAVLTGLPSLTFQHKGSGIQLMADVKKESMLLSAWEAMQS